MAVGLAIFGDDPIAEYKKRHGQEPSIEIADDGTRAARLCLLGSEIASTTAWRTQAIDAERVMPRTLWTAVRRDASYANLRDRLSSDEKHGVAETELAQTRSDLADIDGELAEVESNLREVERVAREIDRRLSADSAAMTPESVLTPGSMTTSQDLLDSNLLVAQTRALRDLI
jgi:hypothetical protein